MSRWMSRTALESAVLTLRTFEEMLPEWFDHEDIYRAIQSSEEWRPAPFNRKASRRILRTILKRAAWGGLLETRTIRKGATRYRAKVYRFKEVENMIIHARVKKKDMDAFLEGDSSRIFEPVEKVVLSDGTRTVLADVREIFPAGILERSLKEERPELREETRPIYVLEFESSVAYKEREYRKMREEVSE